MTRSPASASLSAREFQRYQRHILLPEVGLEGQKRLKDAKVLCIGVGGLGSPLALYLAAAGVGRLGLMDFDAVEASNLQRQILYSADDVGALKTVAAKKRLSALNPDVRVIVHDEPLASGNAEDLFRRYDVIADGTDNFPARYLVNDACLRSGKPNVHGSVSRFEGRVCVFGAKGGPCYRCLYPEPPGAVPSCAQGGVLGALPGVIGAMQALEVLKLILGIGRPLVGRLLLLDALAMEWRSLKVKKNPACPLCGRSRHARAA